MQDNRQAPKGVRRTSRPLSEAGEAHYINRDLSTPPRTEMVRTPRPSKAAAQIAKRKKQKEKRRNFLISVAALLLFLILTVGIITGVIRRAGENAKKAETGEQTAEVTEPTTRETLPSVIPDTDPPETVPKDTLPPADGKKVVCIDPGHGFYDHGTSSAFTDGMYEMDITLDIALILRDKLEAAGYTVIMTHDNNECPKDNPAYIFNAEKRLQYLGTLTGVDLFLSIHCNSFSDVTVSGPRIYYDETNSKKTPDYAAALKDGLMSVFPEGKTPQIYAHPHSSAFLVTKHSYFPAILLETGFVTNENDAKNMLDPAWREQMAQAIAMGISDFLSEK